MKPALVLGHGYEFGCCCNCNFFLAVSWLLPTSLRKNPSFLFSVKNSIPPRAKVLGIWVFSFLSSLFVFHMFISCCRYGSIRFCWWKYSIAPLQCLKFWILKLWALPISFQWLEIFFIHSLCILIFCIYCRLAVAEPAFFVNIRNK